MKLNYRPQINNNNDKKVESKDNIRNETKLSMQSTVSQALASKMPSAPASPIASPASNQGWGKSL